MTRSPNTEDRWTGALAKLPRGARLMLTAFLAIIGTGYLIAVLNIYHSHSKADGVDGMSLDDIRAVYSGLTVARGRPSPSRMLTMIQTTMREYISSEEDFEVLQAWLKEGGGKDTFDEGKGKKTPRRIIMRNCLRCHAASTDTDISRHAPFAPDEWDVKHAGLSEFLSPVAEPGKPTRVPPQYQIPRLILVSHMHMLSIPMFTLVVGLLFMTARVSPGVRGFLTPLPMLALVFDFGGWWLARTADVFIFAIAGAGGVFGVVFGIQLLVVTIDMWRPMREAGSD